MGMVLISISLIYVYNNRPSKFLVILLTIIKIWQITNNNYFQLELKICINLHLRGEAVVVGKSKSESGLGEGALISGDGIGLFNVGIISSNFFFKFFTRSAKALYACKIYK